MFPIHQDPLMILGYVDPGQGYTLFSYRAWLVTFGIGVLLMSVIHRKRLLKFLKAHLPRPWIIFSLLLIFMGVIGILTTPHNEETAYKKRIIILGLSGRRIPRQFCL